MTGILRTPRRAGQPRKLFVHAGQRFGRGVVVDPEIRIPRPSGRDDRGARLRCDCGTEYTALIANLAKGTHTRSCGCWRWDQATGWAASGQPGTTHGLTGHPLYLIHHGMMQRCDDPDHQAFARYGGRRVKACDRWHDIRLFISDIERLIGPRPHYGYSIDRIDNDGHYEPGNVRWATPKEQAANRGTS